MKGYDCCLPVIISTRLLGAADGAWAQIRRETLHEYDENITYLGLKKIHLVCVCVCACTAFTGLVKRFLALHKEHSVMKTDFSQQLPYPYDFCPLISHVSSL
jgi:hypothetical protein